MKLTCKRFFLIVLCFASIINVSAYDFVADNIFYNIVSENSVEVTSFALNKYIGKIRIPSQVIFQGDVYSVTAIGDGAFKYSSITSVAIPNGVKYINSGAFRGCELLSKVVIPNSVTYIGDWAFIDCDRLTSVTIGNSVTSIGRSAFAGCIGLTSIKIPNSVTSIGDLAFSSCSGLTNINIPNSVTSIGNSAFRGCKSLKSINIPNSVTTIGEYVFDSCDSLRTVINLSNLSLESCNLKFSPNTKIFDFSGATQQGDFFFKKDNGQPQLIGYIGNSSKIILPQSYNGSRYCIAASAFNKSHISSISIPNSITSIEDNAFNGCSGLTNINIPNSVTKIGNYAFSGCSGLTNINIPNSVTTIGNYAFSGCSGLTNINIPNSVTKIGDNAFGGCNKLTSITIPNSVTSIGWGAFYNCKSLKSINIPNSVTTIGNYAFSGCIALTSINIPNSVTKIGNYAFSGCSGLTNINIPNGIWINIFNPIAYKALKDIIINDNNITYILSNKNNSWELSIKGNGNMLNIPQLDTYKDIIKQIFIHNGVNSICNNAFKDFSSLQNINIAKTVTHIGDNAFMDCKNIFNISLPDSVTYIGNRAFKNCENLKDISISNFVKFIGNDAFENTSYYNQANGLVYINNWIIGCNSITTDKIKINKEIIGVAAGAFESKNIKKITFNDEIKYVCDSAFANCKLLKNVKWPKNKKNIEININAFYGCDLYKANF